MVSASKYFILQILRLNEFRKCIPRHIWIIRHTHTA